LVLISTPGVSASSRKTFVARALGKPGAVEIDAHLDATIGARVERLHNRPVG